MGVSQVWQMRHWMTGWLQSSPALRVARFQAAPACFWLVACVFADSRVDLDGSTRGICSIAVLIAAPILFAVPSIIAAFYGHDKGVTERGTPPGRTLRRDLQGTGGCRVIARLTASQWQTVERQLDEACSNRSLSVALTILPAPLPALAIAGSMIAAIAYWVTAAASPSVSLSVACSMVAHVLALTVAVLCGTRLFIENGRLSLVWWASPKGRNRVSVAASDACIAINSPMPSSALEAGRPKAVLQIEESRLADPVGLVAFLINPRHIGADADDGLED